MNPRSENIAIAKTILEQLGGKKFVVMTGAKNFAAVESGLRFSLPRYPGVKINTVTITLEAGDTYAIAFDRVTPRKTEGISNVSGAYCDMLQALFTDATGLDTHL